MFENVTYNFYSNDLGRSVVPDEETFNKYKLENVQLLKSILDYVIEREENGIDSAICLMIEKDYENELVLSSDSSLVASESLSGHSISFDNSVKAEELKLNNKSLEEKKMNALKLFCYLDTGF